MNKTRLFRLAFAIIPRLPRRFVQYCGILAGNCMWLLLPNVRQTVSKNLAHVPTLAEQPELLRTTTRQCFVELALNYIDLFSYPDISNVDFIANFPLKTENYVRRALAEGSGCIAISMHLSTFDYAGYRFRTLTSGEVVIPVEELQDRELFQLVNDHRNRTGLDFVPVTEQETMRKMITALKNGGTVMVAVDRDVLHSGAIMNFFGKPARLPTGIITLARITGAPIVFMFGVRENLTLYTAHMKPLALNISRDTRGEAEIIAAYQPLIQEMEDVIMQYPAQWVAAFANDIWVE